MNYARVRWLIIALLCAATTINYIDRQTLSILSPLLRTELHLTEADYANIVTAFLVSYTVMYLVGGRLMDRFGVRVGLTLSLAWWSVATMLTGFARGALTLGAFRFLLGIGEPCVYPAGVKVCGEWFHFPAARNRNGHLLLRQCLGRHSGAAGDRLAHHPLWLALCLSDSRRARPDMAAALVVGLPAHFGASRRASGRPEGTQGPFFANKWPELARIVEAQGGMGTRHPAPF